jgi:hypothetical protein
MRASWTEERRRKNGETHKGKGAPVEHLRALAALKLRLGATHTEESKQKIREARARQAPQSEDARRRSAESAKQRRHTEESKAKIKAAWAARKAQALSLS